MLLKIVRLINNSTTFKFQQTFLKAKMQKSAKQSSSVIFLKYRNVGHKTKDNWSISSVSLLDLRKAFDIVDTNILLHKLALYHCDKSSISWCTSYLQGRTQCVQFKCATSSTIPVTHGVPQGSNLGPLLFITFMNDLPLNIISNTDMYADDPYIHTNAKTGRA